MRPGVATAISMRLLQVAHLLLERGAAVERRRRACRRSLPSGESTSTTCLASSRVGTSTERGGVAGFGLGDGLEHRQAERERLAGAGARLAAHVVAGEGVGDGGLLDGEGFVDALGREGVDELGPQAEITEGRHSVVSSKVATEAGPRQFQASFGTGEVRPRAPR